MVTRLGGAYRNLVSQARPQRSFSKLITSDNPNTRASRPPGGFLRPEPRRARRPCARKVSRRLAVRLTDTRRAPSSPRHACPPYVSNLRRTDARPPPAPALASTAHGGCAATPQNDARTWKKCCAVSRKNGRQNSLMHRLAFRPSQRVPRRSMLSRAAGATNTYDLVRSRQVRPPFARPKRAPGMATVAAADIKRVGY